MNRYDAFTFYNGFKYLNVFLQTRYQVTGVAGNFISTIDEYGYTSNVDSEIVRQFLNADKFKEIVGPSLASARELVVGSQFKQSGRLHTITAIDVAGDTVTTDAASVPTWVFSGLKRQLNINVTYQLQQSEQQQQSFAMKKKNCEVCRPNS